MLAHAMMSCTRRYLNLGSIALVLVLFVPNAQAQGPKEQLQGTIDSVMKVLLTIQSRNDIERKTGNRCESYLWLALIMRRWQGSRRESLGGPEGSGKEFAAVFAEFLRIHT